MVPTDIHQPLHVAQQSAPSVCRPRRQRDCLYRPRTQHLQSTDKTDAQHHRQRPFATLLHRMGLRHCGRRNGKILDLLIYGRRVCDKQGETAARHNAHCCCRPTPAQRAARLARVATCGRRQRKRMGTNVRPWTRPHQSTHHASGTYRGQRPTHQRHLHRQQGQRVGSHERRDKMFRHGQSQRPIYENCRIQRQRNGYAVQSGGRYMGNNRAGLLHHIHKGSVITLCPARIPTLGSVLRPCVGMRVIWRQRCGGKCAHKQTGSTHQHQTQQSYLPLGYIGRQ